MKGFNKRMRVPLRQLDDVIPFRWSLMVKIHSEIKSKWIIMPDQFNDMRNHTRGFVGTIHSMGPMVEESSMAEGLLRDGGVCLFDESVSTDDPNRCFDVPVENERPDRHVLLPMDTVMGVLDGEKVHLLDDRVLVLRNEVRERKAGDIVIPAIEAGRPAGGTVVSTGAGRVSDGRRLPMEVEPGDAVLFPKYGGTDINIWGKEYVVLRQDAILGILEGESDGRGTEKERDHIAGKT